MDWKRNTSYIHSPRPWPDWIPPVESSLSRSRERVVVRKRIRLYRVCVIRFCFRLSTGVAYNLYSFTRQRRDAGISFPFSRACFRRFRANLGKWTVLPGHRLVVSASTRYRHLSFRKGKRIPLASAIYRWLGSAYFR